MTAVLHEFIGRYTDAAMWRRLLYLALSLPIGIATFVVAVVLLSVGVGTIVVWVGLLLLVLLMVQARWWADVDRRLIRSLLGVHIPVPQPLEPVGSRWNRIGKQLSDRTNWKSVVWQLVRLPLGCIGVIPLYLAYGGALYLVSPWLGPISGGPGWAVTLAVVGGVAMILLVPHAVDALSALHVRTARALLGPSATDELQRERARTASAEARTDLARELHDSVGHSVTAALLQATAARRTLETDPEATARALEAVEEQGREALEELDRVLALIRDEGGSADGGAMLTELDGLVRRVQATGQPVTVRVTGDVATVPDDVSRTAYRVIQEALTNAMRHATGAPTHVRIDVTGPSASIVVSNTAGTATVSRPGRRRGLDGIDERVRALGGELEAGPIQNGFIVRATLPITGRP